jgi:hypothetical protein
MKSITVKVHATLHVRDGRIPNLSGMTAQLWDADPINDDLLGEAVLSGSYPDFTTLFTFDLAAAGEARPDLYVLVKTPQGIDIFRSEIHENVHCGKTGTEDAPSTRTLQLKFTEAWH